MAIFYENGVLSKIRFVDESEQEHEPHWYDVGTRFIFSFQNGLFTSEIAQTA